MEKYYKVAESVLTEIADAIRLQKGSDKKYTIDDMPKIIKAMLVLPSGLAETNATVPTEPDAETNVIGIIPTVYKGNADTDGNVPIPIPTVSTLAIGNLV